MLFKKILTASGIFVFCLIVNNWYFNRVIYGFKYSWQEKICTNPDKSLCIAKRKKQAKIKPKKKSDKDIKKQLIWNWLTAWSVALLLYGTGIKRSCNSPPITLDGKQQQNINTNDTHGFHLFIFKRFYSYEKLFTIPNYPSSKVGSYYV